MTSNITLQRCTLYSSTKFSTLLNEVKMTFYPSEYIPHFIIPKYQIMKTKLLKIPFGKRPADANIVD